jgi:hypothetical protein
MIALPDQRRFTFPDTVERDARPVLQLPSSSRRQQAAALFTGTLEQRNIEEIIMCLVKARIDKYRGVMSRVLDSALQRTRRPAADLPQ